MANNTEPLTPVNSQYTLGYGMRLDKGTAPELAHPNVPVTLPDGSEGLSRVKPKTNGSRRSTVPPTWLH